MKFELTEYEKKKANKFRKKHMHGCMSYTFSLTGIGIAVKIKCQKCKKKKNITDYDSW